VSEEPPQPRHPRPGDGSSGRQARPGPGVRPTPAGRTGSGPRTAARQARSRRLSTLTAVAIVLVGIAAAVLVIVRDNGTSTSHAAATSASVAAPPSFGASLPISSAEAAPSASVSVSVSVSAHAGADAELSDPSGFAALLSAAQTAIEAVDSYDYRHLDKDRAAGDAVSTGAFRARYDASLSALAKRAAKTRPVQQAVVQKIAVTSLSGDRAGVLAFGRLDTSTSTSPLASGVTFEKAGSTWVISDMIDLSDRGAFVAVPPGDLALQHAVTAGAQEVVDLLSYSRANFTADFNRALDGLTGALRVQQAQRRASLQQSMNSSQTDYAGQVRSVGVESASGSSVLLLVVATGYQVKAASGAQPLFGTERFEVGVEHVHGRWLVSEYLALPSAG
jgi:hypothetical protein